VLDPAAYRLTFFFVAARLAFFGAATLVFFFVAVFVFALVFFFGRATAIVPLHVAAPHRHA